MASKVLIPCFTRRKTKSRLQLSRPTNHPSIQKEHFLSLYANHEISSFISFSKSPVQTSSKHTSSIFTTKEFPQSTPRLSTKPKKSLKKLKKSSKRTKSKSSLQINLLKKKENLRYLNESLEDSIKNFNGVSTPPEENIIRHRTPSPFSDIIDEQLDKYINSPFVRLNKLDLPKTSFGGIEDSYQYSTAESRKKNLGKVSLEKKIKFPQAPKTPPPFSNYRKNSPGAFKRYKKYK